MECPVQNVGITEPVQCNELLISVQWARTQRVDRGETGPTSTEQGGCSNSGPSSWLEVRPGRVERSTVSVPKPGEAELRSEGRINATQEAAKIDNLIVVIPDPDERSTQARMSRTKHADEGQTEINRTQEVHRDQENTARVIITGEADMVCGPG